MPLSPVDPKELGVYFALAQVGLEMVVPVGIGLAMDHYLGWGPWGVVVGAVLGLVVGLTHLVVITNRHDKSGPSGSRREEP